MTPTARQLAARLRKLKRVRANRHRRAREIGARRGQLSPRQRVEVLKKTAGRCHICGGAIDESWHADHVFAHSSGGPHREDNYLAAHALCNTYRWDYCAGEFQLILKLGGWIANEIRKATPIGRAAAERFSRKESHRYQRTARGSRN